LKFNIHDQIYLDSIELFKTVDKEIEKKQIGGEKFIGAMSENWQGRAYGIHNLIKKHTLHDMTPFHHVNVFADVLFLNILVSTLIEKGLLDLNNQIQQAAALIEESRTWNTKKIKKESIKHVLMLRGVYACTGASKETLSKMMKDVNEGLQVSGDYYKDTQKKTKTQMESQITQLEQQIQILQSQLLSQNNTTQPTNNKKTKKRKSLSEYHDQKPSKKKK